MQKKRIYLAAPIHQAADYENNVMLLKTLRKQGYDVWSPQEAGIATEEAQRTGQPLAEVRKKYMHKDLSAMKCCDICLAYLGRTREPSQGMLWEMGWFTAANKTVVIFNPHKNKFTLMAEFTADFYTEILEECIEILESL